MTRTGAPSARPATESRPARGLRRALAALTALALGAGLAVVGAAAPASAHHNTISGVVVCGAEGALSIEWSVTNSEAGKTEKITGSSNPAVVPVGTTLDKSETRTFTQKDVSIGKTYELELSAEWTKNGQTYRSTDSGTVKVTARSCEQPVEKITFCHKHGGSGNYDLKVDMPIETFFRSGHEDHQNNGDIYPAFVYLKNGVRYEVEAQGDTSLLAYPDCKKPEPKKVPVPATPEIVDLCGTGNDAVKAPAKVEGVTWTISPIVDGTATAVAKTGTGYVFVNGKTEITFELKFPNDAPCVQQLPAPPAPTAAEQCGVDGDRVIVDETVPGVRWEVGEIVYEGTKGQATVVAHAKDGFVFPEGKTSIEFTVTFDGTPCPPETIALVKPALVDQCGVENDSLTLTEQAHVSWKQEGTPASGTVVATATADEGYVFPADDEFAGGPVRVFTITFDTKPCPTVLELPAEPKKIDLCGVDRDAIVEPEPVDGVRWEIGEIVDGKATAVAYAKDGFVFAGGVTKATFEFSFDQTDCVQPSLDGSRAFAMCEANTPWIVFDVTLIDPDGISTGHTAYLVMTDGTNTVKVELGELRADGTIDGRVLWPGAAVDAAGNPIAWPGWMQLPNGRWVVTDGNYGWTRNLASATIEVNPKLSIDLAYPNSADCAPASSPASSGDVTPIANGDGSGLASTGFAGGPLLYVAGGLVLAGAVVLAVTMIVRRRRA